MQGFSKIELPQNLDDYMRLEAAVKALPRDEMLNVFWVMAREDLYFLLRYVLSTKDYFKPNNGIQNTTWLLDRCREVQFNSNRVLDIWARFHWKSNIKTFANLLRKLLVNANETICVLSFTRPNAKNFLAQIQREIVNNQLLKILSYDPISEMHTFPLDSKDLKKNSLDDGIIVNRTANPREPSISAHGLVDSLPVGPHYSVRAYDDVVTKDSVNTPEMIKKTTNAYDLSLPLGMPNDEAWYTGTFYAYDDTYHHIINRGANLRLHPCYEIDGGNSERDNNGRYLRLAFHMDKPVLYTREHLGILFREMGAEEGSKNANMQMLCDPRAGLSTGFRREWIQFYNTIPHYEARDKTCYMLVDPANSKKRDSDYTAMWIVGLGPDHNYYILDIVRDRLSLNERANKVFELHQLWKPIEVRYEQYGLQADIDHIKYLQDSRKYRFNIVPVKGQVRKEDRIERLLPLFKGKKVYFPREHIYVSIEKERRDLVDVFINEEYLAFPHSTFKDMLDALSRIVEPDLPLIWPKGRPRYSPDKTIQTAQTWMSG